jgi:hypothetical protein
MKRNFFGDPVPANFDEIEEALMEIDAVVETVAVLVEFNHEEGEFHGFTATIDDESGSAFTTLGYESKEQLINDLIAAGIGHRQIDEI